MERKLMFIFAGLSLLLFSSLFYTKLKVTDDIPFSQYRSTLDSANKYQSTAKYLEEISFINFESSDYYLKDIYFKKISKSGTSTKVQLGNRKKFVIRYNEIGCNTCVNLIFKDKVKLEKIKKNYQLIVLVDFNNYGDFVKWKRTSEMEDNVSLSKNRN